jgi:hypothetical protein
MNDFPGGAKTGMNKLNRILVHHAEARLYHQKTGRLPAPEELARFITEKRNSELFAFGIKGDLNMARDVLKEDFLHMDLGQVYQSLRKTEEKKYFGQVFTPMAAVEAALNLVEVGPERVIDPACGAGDFLLACRRRWPQAQLTGIDIDPLALAVAETKLNLEGIYNVTLQEANAISLEYPGPFDLVVGNPPWGSSFPCGQYTTTFPPRSNSFLYFLELGARLLPSGGQLVFFLPEAFTKVWTYQKARSWLLKNFAISGLHYIPHLFAGYYAPAVILAAVKLPCPQRKAVPVWYQRDLTKTMVKYNTIPREALQRQRFNINWNREMEDLWQQCCRDAFFLTEGEFGAIPEGKAVVDFSLGVVTGDNRRFIRNKPGPGLHPLLLAKDVLPYVAASPSQWLDYDRGSLQQTAPLKKYLVPAKIVYRFISREIIAAVDLSGSITLNNLNIIIPLSLPFSLEYLVALLNSKLLNTLYMYKFFTGKVLTRQLKQLPLRLGRTQEITVLAKKLSLGKGCREEMDWIIYDLYGLDSSQRNLIAEEYRRLKEMFFV